MKKVLELLTYSRTEAVLEVLADLKIFLHPLYQVTTPSMYAREYGRTMHKRSTIELLLRGKAGPMAATRETPGDQVREPPPATMMMVNIFIYFR